MQTDDSNNDNNKRHTTQHMQTAVSTADIDNLVCMQKRLTNDLHDNSKDNENNKSCNDNGNNNIKRKSR